MHISRAAKVYLLRQGQELQTENTSVKRSENSPIFNEAMVFNVPMDMLQVLIISFCRSRAEFYYTNTVPPFAGYTAKVDRDGNEQRAGREFESVPGGAHCRRFDVYWHRPHSLE